MAHPFSTHDMLTRLEGVLRHLADFVESHDGPGHLPDELRTLSLEVKTAKCETIEPLMVEAERREIAEAAYRRNRIDGGI
jgi:hypothetical protein